MSNINVWQHQYLQIEKTGAYLSGFRNTNFLSFKSRKTTPESWQCATELTIWWNSLLASSSFSLRFVLTYECKSPKDRSKNTYAYESLTKISITLLIPSWGGRWNIGASVSRNLFTSIILQASSVFSSVSTALYKALPPGRSSKRYFPTLHICGKSFVRFVAWWCVIVKFGNGVDSIFVLDALRW